MRRHRFLTYLSLLLSAVSAVLAPASGEIPPFNRYNAVMGLHIFGALLFTDVSVDVTGCYLVWVYEKVYYCYDYFCICYCINLCQIIGMTLFIRPVIIAILAVTLMIAIAVWINLHNQVEKMEV